MVDYYSFLSPEVAEIAQKQEKTVEARLASKLKYESGLISFNEYIQKDWEFDNQFWKYHNQIVPLIHIRVENSRP